MNQKISREERKKEKPLHELRFRRAQSYFDKSVPIRMAIGLTFALFLFLFFHFRETYVETLEVGSLAKRYVVAQVDFAFPDDEATILFKQEAGRSIGAIYRIQESQVNQAVTEFQKYITQSEEGSKTWNEVAADSTFKELASALNLVNDGLLQSRFTDVRTVSTLSELPPQELPLPRGAFYVFLASQEKLEGKLPPQFWSTFHRRIFRKSDISPTITLFIIQFFERNIWKFDEDQGTEYTLRKLVQARIPERYTQVRAGERIVDQGEQVKPKHLAMIQAMKEKLDQERDLSSLAVILGSCFMSLLFLFVGIIYIKENHREIFYSNQKLALVSTIVLLNLLLAKLSDLFFIQSCNNLIDLIRFPLFVPFGTILLGSLINTRMAAFGTLFLSIIFIIILPVETISFLVINIITSTVAILTIRTMRKRKEVFIVCGKAWLASIVVILAFNLYQSRELAWPLLTDFSSTFIFLGITAVLVVSLLPIFESLFHILTDMTLMEFMDPSNELLRRLTIEAPGTYQHSLVVGNLAEAAASAIGANSLFCRVATEYHDIGKLVNPQYFTENQLGGVDMHQLLTPLESASVIISHVSEGVALARKSGLPEPFIDIIKEHYGTTLVYYFYHKEIEVTGDKSKVNERDFRYSGPKPHTKESTIIMIADSLEAAVRSLDVFNEETVSRLVDGLIAQKNEDGQFDESPLTCEELGIVKRTLVKNILAASHPRIKYPPHHPGEEG